MEEKVKLQSVPIEEQVLEQTIAAGERINNGFMPQGSATPDSNCSAHANSSYFQELAELYGTMQPEPCFQNITIDSGLMAEIRQLKLSPNQEYYLHEVVKQIFQFVKEGFMNGTVKVDVLIYSYFMSFGQTGEFLALSKEEQDKRPDLKKCCDHWKGLISPLGRDGNIILTECVGDLRYDDNSIMYPKGTIIGNIEKAPFPAVSESYAYRELLDSDNYSAPHDVLDFVNKKLHEAYPEFNLWCVAFDLESLSIYDLDQLPHMKRY